MAKRTFGRRCRRWCRKLKRWCVRLSSPSFWSSVAHNTCHEFLGHFVKKKTIFVHVFYQVSVASATVACYWHFGVELSELSPILADSISWWYFVFVSILSIFIGMLGMLATCKRSVRLMKVYLFMGPVYAFCGLLCTAPFLVTSCECNNYEQCRLLVAINAGQISNQFPDPHQLDLAPPAMGDKPEQAQEVRQPHPDMSLFSEDDEQESLWDKVDNKLRKTECSCAKVTKHGERLSCRWYEAEGGEIKSWCLVDELSEGACLAKSNKYSLYKVPKSWVEENPQDHVYADIVEDVIEDNSVYWTEDICYRQKSTSQQKAKLPDKMDDSSVVSKKAMPNQGCPASPEVCSGQPMSTREVVRDTLNPEAFGTRPKDKWGERCRKWRTRDVRPWCFVGFDSSCADRKHEKVRPLDINKINELSEVSQFRSSIPCTSDAYQAAEYWCTFLKLVFLLLQAPLAFGILPMYVIIYLFLRNHCGDLVAIRPEFAVEFSDDESEDDFIVRSFTLQGSFLNGRVSDLPMQTGRSFRLSEIELPEKSPPVST